MAGTRFLVAGAVILAWTGYRGAPKPTARHWREAVVIGALLMFCGNGGVVWAEQRVPSGIAALMIATEPLWIVLLDRFRKGGVRPGGLTWFGMALGFLGVALLVIPDRGAAQAAVDPLGAAVLIFSSLAWAIGSLYSRQADLPESPLQSTAMQMLAGGAILVLAGLSLGEYRQVDLSRFSLLSLLSLGYLIVFGSIVAFSAYTWLLKVTTPSKASTYAFVNPIVAVVLGWVFAGEKLTLRMGLAALIIVAGVVLIMFYQRPEIDAQRGRLKPPSP